MVKTEAEYVALGEAGKEALYLRELLESIGFGCRGSTILFQDNKSTIKLTEGSGAHCRTKRISVRWRGIREWIHEGKLTLKYVQTSEQVADTLTKGLSKQKFQHLRNMLITTFSRKTEWIFKEGMGKLEFEVGYTSVVRFPSVYRHP